MCTINKSAHTKKSLETYLMILVYAIYQSRFGAYSYSCIYFFFINSKRACKNLSKTCMRSEWVLFYHFLHPWIGLKLSQSKHHARAQDLSDWDSVLYWLSCACKYLCLVDSSTKMAEAKEHLICALAWWQFVKVKSVVVCQCEKELRGIPSVLIW